MNIIEISISERFAIGPLLGWSFFGPDEEEDFYELNIYLVFFMLHLVWDFD